MSNWAGQRAWPHATVTSLALLLLATCSPVASLAVDNSDSEQRDDETSPASYDMGGSRAEFGSPMEERPLWLLPLFKDFVNKKKDGKMAGVAIRLDPYHLLMHTVSGLWVKDTFDAAEYSSDAVATIGFEHGVEFDSNKSTTIGNQYIPSHYETINHNIAIYNILVRSRWFAPSKQYPDDSSETFEKPPLIESGGFGREQVSWRDCNVLAWGSWNGSSGFDFSLRKIAVRDSDDEKPGTCKDNMCQMELVHDENTGGKLCGAVSDLGAPVLCQGKITFIVTSYNSTKDGCTHQFKAVRLDRNREAIDLAVQDSNGLLIKKTAMEAYRDLLKLGFHPGGLGLKR